MCVHALVLLEHYDSSFIRKLNRKKANDNNWIPSTFTLSSQLTTWDSSLIGYDIFTEAEICVQKNLESLRQACQTHLSPRV